MDPTATLEELRRTKDSTRWWELLRALREWSAREGFMSEEAKVFLRGTDNLTPFVGYERPRADPVTLEVIKERHRGGTRWAAYQNHELGSQRCGHLKFLHIGSGCTFAEPPPHYPAPTVSEGHVYLFVGYLEEDTGEVNEPK